MLTPKMLKLYKLAKEYRIRNGYAPSYEEMADMMGLKSKSGIHKLITGMEQRGAIQRIPGHSRAFKLLPLD